MAPAITPDALIATWTTPTTDELDPLLLQSFLREKPKWPLFVLDEVKLTPTVVHYAGLAFTAADAQRAAERMKAVRAAGPADYLYKSAALLERLDDSTLAMRQVVVEEIERATVVGLTATYDNLRRWKEKRAHDAAPIGRRNIVHAQLAAAIHVFRELADFLRVTQPFAFCVFDSAAHFGTDPNQLGVEDHERAGQYLPPEGRHPGLKLLPSKLGAPGFGELLRLPDYLCGVLRTCGDLVEPPKELPAADRESIRVASIAARNFRAKLVTGAEGAAPGEVYFSRPRR